MTAIILLPVLDILLYIILLILLVRKWTFGKAHKRFALFLIVSITWLILITLETLTRSSLEVYTLLLKLDFSLATIAAPLFLAFTIHFPKQNPKFSTKKETLLFLPIPLLIFAVFKEAIFKVMNVEGLVFNKTFYAFYIVTLMVYFLILGATVLIKKYKNAQGISRLQLKYFISGYIISIAFVLYLSIHNALISIISDLVMTILIHLVIIFPLSVFYSITHYRLLDIRIIIRKSLIYSILFALLLGLAAFGIILISTYLTSALNTTFIVGAAIISVLLAVLFHPTKILIQRLVNSVVFTKTPIYEDQIALVKQTLQDGKEFKKLFAKMEDILRQTLKTDQIFVAIENPSHDALEEHFSHNLICSPPPLNSPIIKHLEEKRALLVREEIPYIIEEDQAQKDILSQAEKFLNKAKAEIVLPLFYDEKIIGLLMLGKKQNQESYSANDIGFLESFQKDFSLAISNTLLYEAAIARAKQTT